MKHFLVVLTLVGFALGSSVAQAQGGDPAPAQKAWEAVIALDAGPQETITSREVARAVTLKHLEKQEAALRNFLTQFPSHPKAIEARLRLAYLFSTRSDMLEDPAPYDTAQRLLDETLKIAPQERKADVSFAKIALAMRRMTLPTEEDRAALVAEMRSFQQKFPEDRRIAGLMAEVATLFDDQPKKKEQLLQQALLLARSDEVHARINDDLKRLSFLGRPVPLQGIAISGETVDVERLRGKVVALYFFAGWSPPSLLRLNEIDALRATFPSSQLEIIGVSLDPTREALDALLKTRKTYAAAPWPILWDGRGWDSPLVRNLAINALPTLWILDSKGRLRTLNAKRGSAEMVRALLKER